MRTTAYIKRLPLHILVVALLFIVSLVAFGHIIHDVIIQKEHEFDMRVLGWVNGVHTRQMTKVMRAITHLASREFLQIGYSVLLLWFLLVLKRKRVAADIAAIGITGFLINFSLKRLFQRVRPDGQLIEELKNFSFPSGHASGGFIFYGLVTYLVWKEDISRTWKWIISVLLLLIVLLIGFSRIYLRVHYATDVIAGFCVGLAWLTMALWLLERLKRRKLAGENNGTEEIPAGRQAR
ncbi:MAG TPA: phosphatase PAP2 family protein [Flavisolibacter sp.]